MTHPIEQYIDALESAAICIPSLPHIFAPRMDDGQPMVSVSGNAVTIGVDIDEQEFKLKCLTTTQASQRYGRGDIPCEKPFTQWRFMADAMRVVDGANRPHNVDIALERIPQGQRLDIFVRQASVQQLHKAVESIGLLAQSLSEYGISHGNIKPSNIYVDNQLSMTIINYEQAERNTQTLHKDNLPLASMAMALYLCSCCPWLVGNNLLSKQNLMAQLRTIGSQLPLADMILRAHNSLPNRERVEQQIALLAKEPRSTLQQTQAPGANQYYDEQGELRDGCRLVLLNERYFYVDSHDKPLTSALFDYAEEFCNARAVVSNGDLFGLIEPRGHYIIRMQYDEVRWYADAGVAIVTHQGQSRLYDRDGQPLSEPYEWMGDCELGLIAASRGDKYGFLDTTGGVAIPLIYDNAYDFRHSVAIVEIAGKEYLINRDAEIVGRP